MKFRITNEDTSHVGLKWHRDRDIVSAGCKPYGSTLVKGWEMSRVNRFTDCSGDNSNISNPDWPLKCVLTQRLAAIWLLHLTFCIQTVEKLTEERHITLSRAMLDYLWLIGCHPWDLSFYHHLFVLLYEKDLWDLGGGWFGHAENWFSMDSVKRKNSSLFGCRKPRLLCNCQWGHDSFHQQHAFPEISIN